MQVVTETPRKIKLPIVDKQVCLASTTNADFLTIANNDFTFCAGKRDGEYQLIQFVIKIVKVRVQKS